MTKADLLMAEANRWIDLGDGVRVHATTLFGFQPMKAATFARPTQDHPTPIIGARVIIGPYAIIYAGCTIGADTQVCPFAHIREGVRIGARCIIGLGAKLGYEAEMGDDCQIMDDSHLSGGTVVGNRTFISVQVAGVNDDTPRGYRWRGVTPVKIGSDCVIGAGARLRPGITIGDGATIAMGAVVTRSVEAGAVIKGPPGRPDAPRTPDLHAVAIIEGTAGP